jgi:hypothetical protein
LRTESEAELEWFEVNTSFEGSSVACLELRIRKRNLAVSRRFGEEMKAKRAADRMENPEKREGAQRMGQHLEKKRSRLLERPQLAIRNRKAYADGRKEQIRTAHEGALAGHRARLQVAERDIQRLRDAKARGGARQCDANRMALLYLRPIPLLLSVGP